MRPWAMVALLGAYAAIAAGAVGCERAVTCGDGTEERDGVCVSTVPPEPAPCGFGTVLDPELEQCVPELPPTTCGEWTACEITEAGYRECACSDVVQECE